MKNRIKFCLAAILVLSLLLTGCRKKIETPPEQTAAQPVNVQGEAGSAASDESAVVRLEDDYYDHVDRKILDQVEIPKDSSGWSYFYQLEKDSYEVLEGVLEEAVKNRKQAKPGSLEQKIADLYLTALDMKGREKAGFGQLKPYLDELNNASDIDGYLKAVGNIYGDLGVNSILTVQWMEDMKDSSRYALYVDGADLGPGKETLEDKTQAKLMDRYQDYIRSTLEYTGMSREEAEKAAADIMALQKDLAASALPLSQQNDPDIIYNPYSMKDLKGLLPEGAADSYLSSAGLTDVDTLVVTQKAQMVKIGKYLTNDHLPVLKNYSIFSLVNDFAPYLTPEIRDNYQDWNNTQNGIKERKTDQKLASERTQNMLGFEFGRLYVEKRFSKEDKTAIEEMVRHILENYKKQIMGLDWMGEETKSAAIKKLDNMTLKIGYPDKWPNDYAKATITPVEKGGNLINNVISLTKAQNAVNREKVRKPVDKTEWGMTPQTVNAYYNPTGNEIVFPAAILQAPFYDADKDYASNLGGIGTVIAHEVSHAFDSSGSLYDENGNYHVWWTSEDRAKFEQLADQVVAYYDGQEGYKGRHVNGAQTLNENIADLGSMACITSIVGDDAESLKLVFEQFATIWAAKYTPESMIRRLNTDVHSPAKVRVNAVLSATDAFYKAYPEIKEGDAMYVAPQKRVKIW
ncbi:M13 family metallopeptidase [Lacrimispora sphenoides]|uniref:Endopeptidase n=1 Tax=Lacrimispora sphenoides JCM 1415 TaxID=1297793 RepID=A0ABY1C189_9FIRM|nr:M13 family metallopeptidase [Lacrimispora sphenoides]SET51581.1 putative endopeptidase [[Clostridium] sphenoides JCM 1415]SUY49549.1 Endothelin-converting enzyme 1 [Lacrimispora sphenoides]